MTLLCVDLPAQANFVTCAHTAIRRDFQGQRHHGTPTKHAHHRDGRHSFTAVSSYYAGTCIEETKKGSFCRCFRPFHPDPTQTWSYLQGAEIYLGPHRSRWRPTRPMTPTRHPDGHVRPIHGHIGRRQPIEKHKKGRTNSHTICSWKWTGVLRFVLRPERYPLKPRRHLIPAPTADHLRTYICSSLCS